MNEEILTMFKEYEGSTISTSLGIAKDLFKGCRAHLVEKSKNDGKRSSVIFTKVDADGNDELGTTGKPLTVVVCVSQQATPLVQKGLITIEHLIGMNVVKAKSGGFFFGMSETALVDDIEVVKWRPIAIALDETIAL